MKEWDHVVSEFETMAERLTYNYKFPFSNGVANGSSSTGQIFRSGGLYLGVEGVS